MTDQNYAHIIVIRDRSGSMTGICEDMDGGLKNYLAEQAAQPGRATFSLYDFDDAFEPVQVFADLATLGPVPPLKPRGSTALQDAVGRAMVAEGEKLDRMAEDSRPGHVLVQIITDGQENASREWTKERVKDLITQQSRDYGWTIAFLGTKIDAFAEAGGLGIGRDQTFNFAPDAAGVARSYAMASSATSQLRGGGGYSLTDDD